MSDQEETNRDRIEAIQKLLPPATDVKRPKNAHASIDELARVLKVRRGQIATWKKGAEPSARYREKLAALSGGRYSADDFRTRGLPRPAEGLAELRATILDLSQELAGLRDEQERTRGQLGRLRSRVAELEGRRSDPGEHRANDESTSQ